MQETSNKQYSSIY